MKNFSSWNDEQLTRMIKVGMDVRRDFQRHKNSAAASTWRNDTHAMILELRRRRTAIAHRILSRCSQAHHAI